MDLSERIQALIDYSGLNVTQFAASVGFTTPQAVREMLKGRTKMLSHKSYELLMSAFPEINGTWLLTGEGSMLNSTTHTTNNVTGHNVCGVNVNGRDIDIKCPTEYETLLNIVNTHNEVVARMQSQIDKAQEQINELIAMLKTKI